MTDLTVEQEIERLTVGVDGVVEDVRRQAGTPIVDPGVENLTRTSELLVQATRESAAELVKRLTQIENAMMDEATRAGQDIQAFNKRLLDHTEIKAKEFSDIFQRFRTAAMGLTQIMEALVVPSDEEPKQ